MKLLFIWIGKSKNGFIQNKGFNVAGNREYKYDSKCRELTWSEKSGYIEGFWNEGNEKIIDLTAIVGENGAGKSSVLSEIMHFDLAKVINENKDIQENERIIVYEHECQIYYDHNLPCEIFAERGISRKRLQEIEECTKIFISNSMKNPLDDIEMNDEAVLRYALTDLTLGYQASWIYDRQAIPDYQYVSEKKNDSLYYDDPETHRVEQKYIDRVRSLNHRLNLSESPYEKVNALMKFFFLYYSNANIEIKGNYNFFKIKVKGIKEIKDNGPLFPILGDERFAEKAEKYAEWCEKNTTLFDNLLALLLLEIEYVYDDWIFQDAREVRYSVLYDVRDDLKSICIGMRGLENSLQENMTMAEYFYNAANDLCMFYETIVKKTKDADQLKLEMCFDLRNKDIKTFVDRIFVSFKRQVPSVFLRYLTFELGENSSGEDALLKLYSRIFWIYNTQKCKKHSLLLIDEIDLYMHPRWQRNLINNLVTDIPEIIGEERIVQIIVTTHSPIFLSDIPRANVLFIKKSNGKCIVESNREHKNTFANNVHTLFLDAFFLDDEGTMGAFAEKKINYLLKMLHSGEEINDEDKKIFKIINCIGDNLIRDKLLEMYEKNQGRQYEVQERNPLGDNLIIDSTIAVLQKQVRELLKTIEQLEKIKND